MASGCGGCPACTVTIREQEVLFSEFEGPVTQPDGTVCHTHISGNPDIEPYDICIPPPPEMSFQMQDQPSNACCRYVVDYDGVNIRTASVGGETRAVRAGRGPATTILQGKNANEPIANSTVCASLWSGCCPTTMRIDFVHSLTARDSFDAAIAVQPQYQINGGAWEIFNTAGRDELCVQGFEGYQCIGEYEYTDHRYVAIPGATTITVCVRLFYLGVIDGNWTQGVVTPNSATLHISRPGVRCCPS